MKVDDKFFLFIVAFFILAFGFIWLNQDFWVQRLDQHVLCDPQNSDAYKVRRATDTTLFVERYRQADYVCKETK